MDSEKYRPRIVDEILQRRLKTSGAVLIKGPKGCGKSTTGMMNSRSFVMLQGTIGENNLYSARKNPSSILEGDTPRLIDEWQMVPSIWDAVRNTVDARESFGQFILTGSSVPQDDGYMHSGVGRISELRMRTMSLFESGDSGGFVSLKKLFDGKQTCAAHSSSHDLRGVIDLVVRGGWPRSVGIDREYAGDIVQNYYNATIGIDVFRVDGKKKDSEAVDRLMRSYARNLSTMANMKTIIADVTVADQRISASTVENYVDALRRLYIVEDVDAWSPSIRSKSSIRQSPKRHFTDPSIAVAALELSSERLLGDLETFGFFMESLAVRDMRIYSQPLGGTVYHYHDSTNLETDIIIQLRDGRWGCIEVKTGAKSIDAGISNLLSLKNLAANVGYTEPSFMMVIISNGYVSQTAEGVWIVPIDCIGP